jgi:spermidine synthase
MRIEKTMKKFSMMVLTSMVFVGAFLLFGLEPLVGRLLTPNFGGAVYVWLTCLVFFQAILLLGYLYVHTLAKKLGFWHLILLALPLSNLPLSISSEPNPRAPFLTLLFVLFLNVALPFLTLSTTAVVAQSWLARSFLLKDYEPYPLYAASNAGSLMALLGYAFLVEPLLGIRVQSLAWTGLYVIYAILVIIAWFLLRPDRGEEVSVSGEPSASGRMAAPTVPDYLKWLLLSALPSALLLAVTNFIALDLGSFPLVWVGPLALYLGSFIITFSKNGGVPKFLQVVWLEIFLFGLILYLLPEHSPIQVVGHLAVFYGICLAAHGNLYERRPPAIYLTNFYLTTAVGGWLGGTLVILIAPYIFNGLFEYPILLLLLGATFWRCHHSLYTTFWFKVSLLLRVGRKLLIMVMVTLITIGTWVAFQQPKRFRHRNFYGTYQILDESPSNELPSGIRKLVHGRTLHGAQLLDTRVRMTPVAYYYRGGAISDVYDVISSPRRIAVVGLGSGTVAAYAKEEDSITFYEIDPDNEWIARSWFTYLGECKGKVNIVVGDGRLSMKKAAQEGMRYDIVLIDAFTGDGIPAHLLTREAIVLYLSSLADNGIILFHISNRFYDLRPVIKSIAADLKLIGAINVPVFKEKLENYQMPNQCVALATDSERLEPLIRRGWIEFGKGDDLEHVSPWTDDYINILVPLASRFNNRYRF